MKNHRIKKRKFPTDLEIEQDLRIQKLEDNATAAYRKAKSYLLKSYLLKRTRILGRNENCC